MTGGAVLRVTGRVFLGLGREPGMEKDGPTEKDVEKADRPLWLMLLPAVVLICVAFAVAVCAGSPLRRHRVVHASQR